MAKHTILKYEFTLVGMDYRVTTPSKNKLKGHLPFKVWIVREPTNDRDENAIAVQIGDHEIPMYPMKIGYLRRQVAKVLAPGLDDGTVEVGKAKLIEIRDDGTGVVEIWLKHRKSKTKLALDKNEIL
jgi:HIRAN domain